MIVYKSEDDGTLYKESEVYIDSETKEAIGYTKFNLIDSFTFTAELCLGHYGSITELLLNAGVLTKL